MKKIFHVLLGLVFIINIAAFKGQDKKPNTQVSTATTQVPQNVAGKTTRTTPPTVLLDNGFAVETFEGAAFPPAGWRVVNPDAGFTFQPYNGVNGPAFGGVNGVLFDFYDYATTGQRDTLFSRVYTNVAAGDSVKFDYAYAPYSSAYNDSLIVLASTNGGQTFTQTLFRNGGVAMGTVPATTNAFVPTSSSQWVTVGGVVPAATSVVLAFITYNAYGNNLYLDNVSVGNQLQNDVAVLSISGLPKDTSYSFAGNATFKVAPQVGILNTGKGNQSSFTATLKAGTYTSTKTVASLGSGAFQQVTFDSLTVVPSTPLNLTAYSSLSNDGNRTNDTLRQYSVVLPGVQRKVVFQEYTSSTCPPCASNNPALDAFIDARYDSVVAIKYHMNWPSPGNDGMYAANATQNNEFRAYYGVNAIPDLFIDGTTNVLSGFTNSTLGTPYVTRLAKGTPLSVSVSDARIVGDSIKANVSINVFSPLAAGSYTLKVSAIEKRLTNAVPAPTNGETVFYDIFRKAYPTSAGVSIATTVGTTQYTYTYKREAAWSDSLVYTAAFVQNDNTKEIVNGGKSAPTKPLLGVSNESTGKPTAFALKQNYPNPFNPATTISYSLATAAEVSLKIYDVLGREVQTLVSGKKSAGSYSVNFDASKLASGVYLYKLQAGSFVETKKMLLVK